MTLARGGGEEREWVDATGEVFVVGGEGGGEGGGGKLHKKKVIIHDRYSTCNVADVHLCVCVCVCVSVPCVVCFVELFWHALEGEEEEERGEGMERVT